MEGVAYLVGSVHAVCSCGCRVWLVGVPMFGQRCARIPQPFPTANRAGRRHVDIDKQYAGSRSGGFVLPCSCRRPCFHQGPFDTEPSGTRPANSPAPPVQPCQTAIILVRAKTPENSKANMPITRAANQCSLDLRLKQCHG